MEKEQPIKQLRRNPAEHLKCYQFQPGVSGNPKGRKKGSKSLKTYAREYLESLPDEDKLDYMRGMDKKIIWEMGEGKAEAKSILEATIEHTVNKEEINKALDDIIGKD